MRKLFLLGLLIFSTFIWATPPTITIDGDKSDWAEVPMLSEPGAWPMLKVLPAADAELGTNALVYMMENTVDFDPTWSQYPKAFIDKDYDGATSTITSYWAFDAMGLEYSATTGAQIGDDWVSFPAAVSSDNKVFEIGFPATFITDLDSKFSFAMYYNSGAWFCPDRSEPAVNAFSPANGFLYKTRSFTTVAGTTNLTTANVFAHPSMGEIGAYVDFGLRDNGYDTIRWAAFPIELTKQGVYKVKTNVSSTLGWKFEFWLVDVETNAVVAHIDAPENNVSSSKTSYTFGSLDLTSLPTGKYMLKVKNRTPYSTVKLNSVELEYNGGAPVAIPGTLSFDDVILSDEAWIDKSGAVDSLLFTARGSEGHNSVNFAKWKINVTQAGAYDFTANVCRPDGSQRYEIKVLSNDEGTELKSNSLTGMPTGNASISTGAVYLEEGVYTVKVRNTYDHAKSRLLSVVATYIGGAVQNMPGTTAINDAWFSDGGTRADGKISFPGSEIATSWVRWNVRFAAGGYYNVKVNFSATNDHNIGVRIFNGEGNVLDKHEVTVGDQTSAASPCDLGEVFIAAGDYTLEVTNPIEWSNAQLQSVLIEAVVSSAITLPTTLDFADADKSDKVHITDGKLWFNEIGDSNPVGQWARWEVEADHAGTYLFTMGVSSTNSQSYRITISNSSNNNEVAVYDKNPGGSGDKTITHYFYLEAGSYFVKVENTHSWSQGHIVSLVVTEPSILSLDQTATSAPGEAASQTIQIMRTFVGGVYNTICLPFGVGSSKMREAFGSDVVLKKLNTAEFDEEASILDLNFEDVSSSGIYQGTPYIIKPSQNIVNPVFENVEILSTTHAGTTERNKADFIGTFVATNVPAGENNLYLGPNNSLYFSPDAATPIKGFRGWFVVHDIPGGAKAIKRARIVEGEQEVQAIDFVNGENSKAQKVLRDGQLIIIRDGVEFTVQGQRIQ